MWLTSQISIREKASQAGDDGSVAPPSASPASPGAWDCEQPGHGPCPGTLLPDRIAYVVSRIVEGDCSVIVVLQGDR